jgi:hypothetical protein
VTVGSVYMPEWRDNLDPLTGRQAAYQLAGQGLCLLDTDEQSMLGAPGLHLQSVLARW